jgi:hypothetical protein
MLMQRANYIFNFGSVVGMFILAGVITSYTSWASNARDESAVVWEDSCTVSSMLHETGAVTLTCATNDGDVTLASLYTEYIARIGNTPIAERTQVPAECRSYQSGRWTCRIGSEGEFVQFGKLISRKG